MHRVIALLDAAARQLQSNQLAQGLVLEATSLLCEQIDPQAMARAPTGRTRPRAWHVRRVLEYVDRHLSTRVPPDFARTNRVCLIGELAASLAHEITEPLASARNNARAAQNFVEMQPPNLCEIREALACIVVDVDRAGDIIGRIHENIKKAPPRTERFDLNTAINEVIALMRSVIVRNRVLVPARLADGLFLVQGDRIQLQQVVMNLVLNAVEAMGTVEVEAGPRKLLISTEPDHSGVLVAVRDSGPSIDPEHLERIFQSLYTTKPGGTGMGLSICRSIVEAHGGRLWAEANEPRGAVFWFTLPSAG